MPALVRTAIAGRIAWLGRVPDREATLRSQPLEAVAARLDGFDGEAHGGLMRPSCSRVAHLHPRGTPIRNTRQIAIVSVEEMADVAQAMGVLAFDPAWSGASMAVEGIPDLSHLPPSSRLQAPGGATLVVDMANWPCHLPARVIEEDAPGRGASFQRAARGRRGVTAWVEREGLLHVGDALTLFVPDQRAWRPFDEARRPPCAAARAPQAGVRAASGPPPRAR